TGTLKVKEGFSESLDDRCAPSFWSFSPATAVRDAALKAKLKKMVDPAFQQRKKRALNINVFQPLVIIQESSQLRKQWMHYVSSGNEKQQGKLMVKVGSSSLASSCDSHFLKTFRGPNRRIRVQRPKTVTQPGNCYLPFTVISEVLCW